MLLSLEACFITLGHGLPLVLGPCVCTTLSLTCVFEAGPLQGW